MKSIKVIISTLIISSVVLTGCGAKGNFIDGEYQGVGAGKNGDLKVAVTVSKNKISDIKVLEHKETPGLSDGILKDIPAKIIKEQSTDVEIVSGATVTSNAIIDAVKDSLKTASK
jgi:uncharacterized protein with FMN-binding domain